ncbi:MAG TPA: NADP-dependent malic enzyme [Nitrososphaeraceae archaeon]|nr:NADP-dependent malic enzyme [Nitrososphaeraceae archaeon]
MNIREDSLNLHRMLKGKIEIHNRVPVENIFEKENGLINLIYTPGVAYVAKEISKDKELAYEYTSKWNNVAIICDGTRVLGLGNIGPEAAIPVMEGKSVLFKLLGGINAIPLCIATQDKEEIIKFVKSVEPMFGAINIEDIESPKVLDIIERLKHEISLPVFHDDQHGTAIITLSALLNALTLLEKKLTDIHVVILGAGSAGYGICKILHAAGCTDIVVIDSHGSIYEGRDHMTGNPYKQEIATKTNRRKISGNLDEVLKGADVFIGVSGKAKVLTSQMIKSMNSNPIIFALSNPDPEIFPDDAIKAGAKIIATGRSDFPNQINNATVFPSVLRALLDLRVKFLSEDLLVTVAQSIAGLVDKQHLKENYIIPQINDQRILPIVTQTMTDVMKQHLSK